jgi:putative oxidoreductase
MRSMASSSLLLPGLSRYGDLGLFALRVFVGVFLIYGVQDNVLSGERMEEFVRFMRANGFAWPEGLARLSVYAQLICGSLFVAGLLTRLAGVVMAGHFIVAVVMVHWGQDFRAQFPALVLVFLSAYFALQGGGRYALDRFIGGR